MAGYPLDSLVSVPPFSHRLDGDQVIIGNLDEEVFLAIPEPGLDILQNLAAGKTVGETVRLYEEKHQETPDIDDFLDTLTMEGFLQRQPEAIVESHHHHETPGRFAWSMNWVSPAAARLIFGPAAMTVYLAITAWGFFLVGTDISLLPDPKALLFEDHFAILTWATLFFTLVGVVIHEMAHMVAARIAGIPSRFGMGNRLYFLVAETNMTRIWLAPKRQRYLAFVSGPIVDGVTFSLLVTTLWANKNGDIHLAPWGLMLLEAVLFMNMMRILWQLFFFVRTDLYYCIATAFNCSSLMTDTEDLLRNIPNRIRRARDHIVDQSHLPKKERRVIRGFAVFWILGRLLALFALFGNALPILYGYFHEVALLVTGGDTRFGSADFVTVFIIALVIEISGLTMWIRAIRRTRHQRKAARLARAARSRQLAGPQLISAS